MDWTSIAALLAEQSDKPLVLLDRLGRIRLSSRTLETLLGIPRRDLLNRTWDSLAAPGANPWLDSALTGATTTLHTELQCPDGRRLSLVLKVAALGRDPEPAVLLMVERSSVLRPTVEQLRGTEVDYTISATAVRFGRLEQLKGFSADLGILRGENSCTCFKALHGRTEPCAECPVLRPLSEPWPRILVRRSAHKPDQFEVVTAQPSGHASVEVSVKTISDQALAEIHKTKIRALADRGKLTARERDVLDYMLMGRSLEDIASLLAIGRRTAKFHQSNVLEKLGADSRVDLIRLVGF
jgi:DNA-binding CsgD family transcriptional regulator